MELNTKPIYEKNILEIAPFFGGKNDRDRVLSATLAVFQTTQDNGPNWLASFAGNQVVAIHKDVIDQKEKTRCYTTIDKKGAESRWEPENTLSKFSVTNTWQAKKPVKLEGNYDWQSRSSKEWQTDLRDNLGILPKRYTSDEVYRHLNEMMKKAFLGHLFDRVDGCNRKLEEVQLVGNLSLWQQQEDKTEEKLEAILDHYQIPQSLRTIVKYDGIISLASLLNTKGDDGKRALVWIDSSNSASAGKTTHLWKLTSGKGFSLFPNLFPETK